MKKLLQSLFILLFVATTAMAQTRTITGTVSSKEDGLPLPGVSVKVKGTNVGVSTGANGKYSINVPARATALEFSSIGFVSQSINLGASRTINVVLVADSKVLDEVVVQGAYGIKTTSRAASANTQTITGETLNTVRGTNINNALAGKVAGVQVRSQSAAALGRNTQVRLRGASGFGLGSGALYVVDGTILPNADDLNLDDIEDVSVLQGPAAAAILGSQASAGAILITTKKGKKLDGTGISLNLGATFENTYILPNYQNSYAGGNASDLIQYNWQPGQPVEWQALDGKYYHNYSDDSSWGPKMVGQEYIPWYAWYPGTAYSFKTASLTPQPDNARDFFRTGVTLNNSVTFSNAGERYNIKMTYGNQSTQGLLPESSLKKNTLNLVANYDLNKHFSVGANINYVTTNLSGDINDAYSSTSTGSFNQWFHRNLDMDKMKELQNMSIAGPGGITIFGSWNHNDPTSYNPANTKSFYAANYWYNPYTYYNLAISDSRRDRLYGNVSLTYKVNDDLKFTGTYRKQQNTTYGETRFSSKLEQSQTQATGNDARLKGYYATSTSFSNRENYEFIANYAKKFNDFTVDVTGGVDIFNAISKSNGGNTVNGLSIPDLFTLGNSVDTYSVSNGRSAEKYRALLARGTFGYKNMLFVDGSIRNDWFSTLPPKNNDVLSKSVGASFVFGDLITKNGAAKWLSLAKVRASYGEIPQSLGAYTYPGFAYGVGSLKWNGNLLMSTPDSQVDPDIKGATSSNYEFGIDLGFLRNRVTFSATYWNAKEIDFPRSVSINGASGFSSITTNIGRIDKEGIELQFGVKPVVSPNFKWTLGVSYADLLNNKVVEISKKYEVTRIGVEGVWGSTMPYMIHQEGKQWGQIFGNGKKRNAAGVPIITASGSFVNDNSVYFGSVLPAQTGGIQNSFQIFKDFEVNANIDYQFGGKFVSLSNMWGSYSGLTARTAGLNDKGNPVRDAVVNGGGVRVDGFNETTNQMETVYVEGQTYFQNLYNNKTFDDYVYDLTFVKLREVSLGYRIPTKKLGLSKYINNATFSVIGRNLLLLYAKTKDFDPSEVAYSSGETAQLPGTRGFGFNLKIGF